jgi:pSer/pThr/pTyr-binding forkhead associated (FHA) protein
MHVKLKVLRGASAGKEVAISAPRFFIGRSEECQLRVNSDAISRRHCAITLEQGEVRIRDLGSRNGTYVNGTRIDGEHRIQMGDQLRVGPLEFLVTFLKAASSPKAAQAATKPNSAGSSAKAASLSDDEMAGLIDDWLSEGDQTERHTRSYTGETREFRLDETNRIEAPAKPDKADKTDKPVAPSAPNGQPAAAADRPERAPVLPTGRRGAAKSPPKDTQEAAAQTLRKFFNRGG